MSPDARDLFRDLEEIQGLRQRDRNRLRAIRRAHTRPLWLLWTADLIIFAVLYGVGYVGAMTYWTTLQRLWEPRLVVMFAPVGHAIPAVMVGVRAGQLFGQGRFFFLVGIGVVIAAVFVREVWLPWGGAEALDAPFWLYWAACAEGVVASGIAMFLGATVGRRLLD